MVSAQGVGTSRSALLGLWGAAYLSLSLSASNGFHEKAFCVNVNVVTEAETKAAEENASFAMLPFALSLSPLLGGSVQDGFRPGLRRCNLKCGLFCLDRSHLAQSPLHTGPSGVLDVRRFVHLGPDAFC
jgi:hypothetical protein